MSAPDQDAELPTDGEGETKEQLFAGGTPSVKMSTAGSRGWTPPTVEEVATLLPQYEIFTLLGHGGMGAVYQGRQEGLDRIVAIKLLPLEVSVDPNFAERFRREARAMARLNHPNIVTVHDSGQTSQGHLFFVMEFVDGWMLHDLIHSESSLTPGVALGLIEQICDALAFAHGQGVVHRDIKPANVLVSREGRVKVADFGLARLTDPAALDSQGITLSGAVMGTPDYMSPEQKRGLQVDHRSDIYALGVVLYEMLCKETPQGAFELPSSRCGIDVRIDAIVTRALAPQPSRRFQDTTEFKTAISAVRPSIVKKEARRPVLVAQVPRLRSPAAVSHRKRKGKRPLIVGLATVMAAIIAVLFLKQPVEKPKTATPFQKPTAETPRQLPQEVPPPREKSPGPPPAEKAMTAVPSADLPEAADPAKPASEVVLGPPGALAYGGHKYLLVKAEVTWDEARDAAEKMGGHLATLTSKEENDWAMATFLVTRSRIWIGGHRIGEGYGWEWITGERWDFTAWAEGEPNRSNDLEEALELSQRGVTGWNDVGGYTREYFDNSGTKPGATSYLVEWELFQSAESRIVAAVPSAGASTEVSPQSAPPSAIKVSPEVQKWMREMSATFEARYQREAIAPYDTAVKALRDQYVAAVQRNGATATTAARLEEAIAWRSELVRLEAGEQPHSAPEEAEAPKAIKELRANWNRLFTKLERERFERARPVHKAYDELLAKNQAALTQRSRFDDALALRKKRDAITGEWVAPRVDLITPPPALSVKPGRGAEGPEARPKGAASDEKSGKLTGRKAAEHLLKLGLRLFVLSDNQEVMVTSADQLPRGRVEVLQIDQPAGANPTDSDFSLIGALPKLRVIYLFSDEMTSRGLAFLSHSPDLLKVYLHGEQLDDAILDALLPLKKVQSLTIYGRETAAMTCRRLGELACLPELRTLHLQLQAFDPAALDGLKAARKLESLTVVVTRSFHELGYAAIAAIPSLQSLRFIIAGDGSVAGIEKLSTLPLLRELHLAGRVTDTKFIGGMRKLQALSLEPVAFDELLKAKSVPLLQELNLSGAGEVADSTLEAITQKFPKLQALTLTSVSTSITPQGLRKYGDSSELQRFHWSAQPITAEQISALAEFRHLDHLQIKHCKLTNDMVGPLAKSKRLRHLALHDTGLGITPEVAEILKSLRTLEVLSIGKTGISTADLPAMKKLLPGCAIVFE